VAVDSVVANDIVLLLPIKKQLVWLNLGNKKITDSLLITIAQLTGIIRLQLDNTSITDKGLSALRSLINLQYLNIVGTKVTTQGIIQLKDLSHLQAIYLYKTFISSSDWPVLKNNFPKVTLDTGGYRIDFLETDTMTVKPPPKKE
jgi:hypothetical protein